MNKILITGSSGFLGKNLFNFLNNQYDTYGLSRNDVDLNDFTATRSYIEKINPSLIIHCAWNLKKAHNDFNTQYKNYQMTKNLVDICVENNIKIMCIGSCLEYSPGPKIMKEADQTFPVNLYGFAKKECLSYLQEKKYKNYVWIRLFHVFGKGGNNIINETVNSLQNNKKIKLSKCEQNIDYLYIKDFLCAIGLILEKDFTGVINICNNSKLSLKKTILEMAKTLNKNQELIDFDSVVPTNTYSYVGDNSILRRLGYKQQYSFKEAIKDML